MAKSEFFTDKGLFVKLFMKSLGAFPVKRNSSDMKSVSDAISILNKDKQLGIFPQGKIVKNNRFEMKSGAALLSVKTDSIIIPVSIYTSNKIRMFSKITVTFGKPIEVECDTRSSIKQARLITKKIKEQISAQLEEKHCQ